MTSSPERLSGPRRAGLAAQIAEDPRDALSCLWVFAMLNYLYADVIGLMDAPLLRGYLAGHIDGLDITPTFLLGAAVLMEIPIAMTLAARFLPYRANRWANIASGGLKSVVVVATLFVGIPSPAYIFFAVIEVCCTTLIVVIAWRWRERCDATQDMLHPQIAA